MSASQDRIKLFFSAVKAGDIARIKLLLRSGVPFDCENNRALILAASHGQAHAFKLLLEAGASIDVRDSIGESLLPCACRSGSLEIVDSILNRAHLSQRDLDECLLHPPEKEEILNRLLTKGANPKYIDENGANCLLHAILFNKNEGLALRLYELGADATIRVPRDYEDPLIGDIYKMPLHELAERKNMPKLVEAILKRPGDLIRQPKTQLPKKISDCWVSIKQQVTGIAPGVKFPAAIDENELLQLNKLAISGSGLTAITELYKCVNGTPDFAIFPMPNDTSYAMMGLHNAISSTKMTIDVLKSEYTDDEKCPWRNDWFAFAENGAGDFLVIKSTGECFQFSHETRRTIPRNNSLLELLQEISQGLETGKYHINAAARTIE